MKMRRTVQSDETLITLSGSLDDMTSRDLEERLESLLKTESPFLRFNLADVDYISSSGIRVLILAHKKAIKLGKKVIIGEMSEKVREVFDMLGILPLFRR